MPGKYKMPREISIFLGKVNSYLKQQWGTILIGLFSVLGAHWIELYIKAEYIDSVILVIGFTMGTIFLLFMNAPLVSLLTGSLSLLFYSCSSLPYVRQIVLTVVIAGYFIVIRDKLNGQDE